MREVSDIRPLTAAAVFVLGVAAGWFASRTSSDRDEWHGALLRGTAPARVNVRTGWVEMWNHGAWERLDGLGQEPDRK